MDNPVLGIELGPSGQRFAQRGRDSRQIVRMDRLAPVVGGIDRPGFLAEEQPIDAGIAVDPAGGGVIAPGEQVGAVERQFQASATGVLRLFTLLALADVGRDTMDLCADAVLIGDQDRAGIEPGGAAIATSHPELLAERLPLDRQPPQRRLDPQPVFRMQTPPPGTEPSAALDGEAEGRAQRVGNTQSARRRMQRPDMQLRRFHRLLQILFALAQGADHGAPVGDVLGDADHAVDRAIVAAHGDAAIADPALRAVAGSDAVLDREMIISFGRIAQRLEGGDDRRAIIAMDLVRPARLAGQQPGFVATPAAAVAGADIDLPPGPPVDDPEHVVDIFDQHAEALLHLAQFRAGTAGRRDVAQADGQLYRAARGIALDADAGAQAAHLRIRPAIIDAVAEIGAGGGAGDNQFLDDRPQRQQIPGL